MSIAATPRRIGIAGLGTVGASVVRLIAKRVTSNQITSAVREQFYSKVAGKQAAQVKAAWSRLVFSGKATPPKELGSSADVKKFVAANPDAIGYLQYSSGSTRFPHGVAITHRGLLNNLAAHGHGMQVRDSDRCVSWLPWYHDMGLVGCFLSVVANQVSVDYMKTEDFARRPLAWLDLVTRNTRAGDTSIRYSPTFG